MEDRSNVYAGVSSPNSSVERSMTCRELPSFGNAWKAPWRGRILAVQEETFLRRKNFEEVL
jgi:hypothetical protein